MTTLMTSKVRAVSRLGFGFFLTAMVGLGTTHPCEARSFQPLLGSEWAKENPGKLPFAKCAITGNIDLSSQETKESGAWHNPALKVWGGGMGITGEHPAETRDGLLYLSCVSYRHNLAYKIPVWIPEILNVLDFTALLYSRNLRLVFEGEDLNSKSLSEVFGDYSGGLAKFAMLGGGAESEVYQNSNRIRLHNYRQWERTGSLFSLGLGMSYFSIKQPEVRQEHQIDLKDGYLLTDGTQGLGRSNDSSFRLVSHRNRGEVAVIHFENSSESAVDSHWDRSQEGPHFAYFFDDHFWDMRFQTPVEIPAEYLPALRDGSTFLRFNRDLGLYSVDGEARKWLVYHSTNHRGVMRDLAKGMNYSSLATYTFERDF